MHTSAGSRSWMRFLRAKLDASTVWISFVLACAGMRAYAYACRCVHMYTCLHPKHTHKVYASLCVRAVLSCDMRMQRAHAKHGDQQTDTYPAPLRWPAPSSQASSLAGLQTPRANRSRPQTNFESRRMPCI